MVKNRPHPCGLLVRLFYELTFATARSGCHSLIETTCCVAVKRSLYAIWIKISCRM
jgi:hypothetical protein